MKKMISISVLLFLLLISVSYALQSNTTTTVYVPGLNMTMNLITDRAFYQPSQTCTMTVQITNKESFGINTSVLIQLLKDSIVERTLIDDTVSINPNGQTTQYWNTNFLGIEPGTYTLKASLVDTATANPLLNTSGQPIIADTAIEIVPEVGAGAVIPPPEEVIPEVQPKPTIEFPPLMEIIIGPGTGSGTLLLTGGWCNTTLCPNSSALIVQNLSYIYNVSKIDPFEYAPLACKQRVLDGYEINISAEQILYCLNYANITDGVNESSIYVYKFNQSWYALPNGTVFSDREAKIVCANITAGEFLAMGPQTPYMIAGFTNILPNATAQQAAAAIRSANQIAGLVKKIGFDTSAADRLIRTAVNQYIACDWDAALALATSARNETLKPIIILVIAAVCVIAGIGYYGYKKLRARIKPEIKPMEVPEVKPEAAAEAKPPKTVSEIITQIIKEIKPMVKPEVKPKAKGKGRLKKR